MKASLVLLIQNVTKKEPAIAENLLAFEKLDCLPRTISLSQLDKGEGIEAGFQNHKAKWHDSCRLKFNKTELQRAEKRKVAPENILPSNVYKMFTRTSKKRLHSTAHSVFLRYRGSSW